MTSNWPVDLKFPNIIPCHQMLSSKITQQSTSFPKEKKKYLDTIYLISKRKNPLTLDRQK